MKKIIKTALILIALAVTVGVLCSCDTVDELKEQRIDLSEGGLEYKGNLYIALENNHDRTVDFEEYLRCYVVEKSTPLLLIQDKGESAFYSSDKDMIRYDDVYYCTAEKYDFYESIFENGEFGHYRAHKHVVDTKMGQLFTEYYIIGEGLTEQIKTTLAEGRSILVPKEKREQFKTMSLPACDKDRILLEKDAPLLFVDTEENRCGLTENAGGYWSVVYLPDECYDEVANIVRDADFDLAYAKLKG